MKFTIVLNRLLLMAALAWAAASAVALPVRAECFAMPFATVATEVADSAMTDPSAESEIASSDAPADFGDRALLIATLLLVIGVPYWLGVACVRRCHREGWTVYTKRRHVVAWALLPPVLLLTVLFLLGDHGEPTAQDEASSTPATLAMLLFPVAWLGLQARSAARLNPGLSAGAWCIVWQARVGAALIALVVSWFLITTLNSKQRDGESSAQHAVRKALWLAVLGWIGATYLNFVCDPAKARLQQRAEV